MFLRICIWLQLTFFPAVLIPPPGRRTHFRGLADFFFGLMRNDGSKKFVPKLDKMPFLIVFWTKFCRNCPKILFPEGKKMTFGGGGRVPGTCQPLVQRPPPWRTWVIGHWTWGGTLLFIWKKSE